MTVATMILQKKTRKDEKTHTDTLLAEMHQGTTPSLESEKVRADRWQKHRHNYLTDRSHQSKAENEREFRKTPRGYRWRTFRVSKPRNGRNRKITDNERGWGVSAPNQVQVKESVK